jgi:hypothetical protein
MSPQMIAMIAQLLVQYGPGIAVDFTNLFHKSATDTVTKDDVIAILTKIRQEDYDTMRNAFYASLNVPVPVLKP